MNKGFPTRNLEKSSSSNIQIDYYENNHKYLEVSVCMRVSLMLEETIRRGRLTKTDTLLELGAGYGRFTIPFLERGFSVTPSDISPVMIERLKKNLTEHQSKSNVLEINIEAPPLEIEKFDVICGFHILHHLRDLPKAFEYMQEYLNHPGKIVFLEPNPLNILYYIQGILTKEMKWEAEKGVLNMRNHYLQTILAEVGFRKINISNFGFFPDQIINTKIGEKLERLLNKTQKNPIALYKLIKAEN